MKTIDLRGKLPRPKYSVSKQTTLHINGKYIGFRHSGLGVGFVKRTKSGVILFKSGNVIWYHTVETGLIDAVRYVRKTYKVNMPVSGWKTLRVNHYNNSTVNEIIKALN